jgi:hypothetical protein
MKARWKARSSRPAAAQNEAIALPTPLRLAKSMNRSAAQVSTCWSLCAATISL